VSFLSLRSFVFQPLVTTVFRTVSALGLSAALASPAWSAPFEDTIAQRTQACTACHGAQGRAAPDGYYPRLAGKPAAYLYNQLLHFREGRRHYGLMTQMVEPLTDAYLLEIAQYFADLKVPYPPPQASTASAALLEQGRQLVMNGDPARQVPACVQCHGMAMTGVLPQVPGLLGLPRDYVNAQLGAWKAGKRRAHAPDCMAHVAENLSLDDINAASTWLAAQAVPFNSAPALSAANLRTNVAVPACGHVSLPQPTGAFK